MNNNLYSLRDKYKMLAIISGVTMGICGIAEVITSTHNIRIDYELTSDGKIARKINLCTEYIDRT